MSSEHIQSKEELQQHLRDTIQALDLSSRSFDGDLKERLIGSLLLSEFSCMTLALQNLC